MDATYQYLVRMLAHEMKHYADRKLDEYNVTQEQSHTLGYMYRHKDRGITQNELLKTFKRKGSTVSSTLKGLENKGLIYRMVDPDDSRRKNLKLTQEGMKLVESFVCIFDDIEAILVKDFNESEKQQLKDLFERMLNNIKTEK
ncbi:MULTISPECIES: MarR family winged helix-turn-helix transcriptional regulator [Staphylococcus]|jgi:MarR family transcriptional repressor of mepA|uniref:Multidrug efflux transporter transcriptional repressor MepR n=3 Tax=Bacillales TaxID=1385 RepID=A0A640MYH8_BACAN|nr:MULTISPECIES: MarR family transcriptional regulator [Staphylococcus]KDP55899.1 MarR family protein [Staphylococcus aureus subsp. aureus CO-98]MDU2096862.1 MarR family transcriptional regulator [Staphylococcus sp.]GEU18883.1 multidrug efflux transporter transcriptional repressor MepR [Bacillus anthracis]AKC75448.1 mepA/mepB repressor and autoregulator [Staphylococcus haemolyticus]AMW24120.1 MarR family transcriptional regulator [Staphylococcus haemolyticus]